ncbi:DUF4900 domain-containing protein [Deinococcus ruber]|uniref:DUF4900 domain-containing protein n=1 Tax=Deinococcus ruber TaxID=1848197 RepID=A0A918C617_9DEIO|nr:DUF4900 domain-containing protein [Deinococcus ruber]GGR07638.1 hypothetical protein GCM10008957_20400 [Deinococcus ruber]
MNKKSKANGFILITVLMMMVLIATIGVTLFIKSSSEAKQVGNSQNQAQARAYAEAGQADMFFYIANPGLAVINSVIKPYSDAFANSNGNAATTAIIPTSAYNSILTSLVPQFPDIVTASEGYTITSHIIFRTLRTDTGGFTKVGTSQVQPYFLDYSITGSATQGTNGNKRTVITEGTVKIILGRIPLNQYILLANDGGSGTDGKQGFFDGTSSYDGPVHVNGNLALSGKPTFSLGLTVSSSSIWMNSSTTTTNGNCNGYTFTQVVGQQSSGCTVPNTNGQGIQYNTDTIPLPTNAASQNRAALGLDSTNLAVVSKSEACVALGLLSTCASVPTGAYLPLQNGKPSGGIYVQGDAKLTLSTASGKQIYTIVDANGKTTVITIDYVAATTTVLSPTGTTSVYPGVINGQVYVTGNLTSLSGPPRTGTLPNPAPSTSVPTVVSPAIASKTQLNIAAGGSVTVNGDITYTDDPRAVNGAQNVLGIISGSQNVNIGTSAPNDVYIQAAILTGATGTGLGVVNYNGGTGSRGSIHLLGSLAEDTDQLRGVLDNSGNPIRGYSDDLHFDQRFLNGGAVPPFFPATQRFGVQAGYPIQRTWTEN